MSDQHHPPPWRRPVSADDDDLIDGLPPSLDGALRSVGLDTRDPDVVRAAELTLQITSGSLPMPPPEILSEYEKRFPGLVKRFISWTEDQRKHRFTIERTRVDREERRLDRSQTFAFLTAIVGLLLTTYIATATTSFGNTVASWIVPCIMAVVSIGGPTAAVYLARMNIKDASKPD